MRTISTLVNGALGVVAVAALVVACGKKDETPPPAAAQPGYPQQGYPQQGYPQQGAPQQGYPQQGYPAAAPTGPVAGQMSVPGPSALPCQNDSSCMTHRCNTQYGKCAFPCQSDADCLQGSTCFVAGGALAACIPKPPGQ